MFLNVANMVTNTRSLGPGQRSVIWVQGCKLRCPGCIAPGWLPFEASTQLTPQAVVDRLVSEQIDGLTFSGGEPMEQAEALSEVARLARGKKEIDIICFSGYRYQTLLYRPPNPGVARLLPFLDVLIDGPYIREKNNARGLRGSTNQRIIHLTDRLKDLRLEDQERRLEFKIQDGSITLVGIPSPAAGSAFGNLLSGNIGRTGRISP